MKRYVALYFSDLGEIIGVKAIDAPDRHKAYKAARHVKRPLDWHRVHIMTPARAEKLKNQLERAESKREADLVWRKPCADS